MGALVLDDPAALDAAVAQVSDGRGVDCVVITAGGASVLPAAAARVRDGGTLHYFAGGPGESLPLALATLYHPDLILTPPYSPSPPHLPQPSALLLTPRVPVHGLTT